MSRSVVIIINRFVLDCNVHAVCFASLVIVVIIVKLFCVRWKGSQLLGK